MYVCHEKVTPSWIVDDDDTFLPTLARSLLETLTFTPFDVLPITGSPINIPLHV